MVYVIETIVNGGTVDQDYKEHGYADGDVKLTDLNENVAAEGTADKLAEVEAALADGSLQVFDTSKFTVDGKTPTKGLVDMDGDFEGEEDYNAIFDGYYHETSGEKPGKRDYIHTEEGTFAVLFWCFVKDKEARKKWNKIMQ